jgi:hypothetical protein
MKSRVVPALTAAIIAIAPAAEATAPYPACHMHKSRDVSFRNATSRDVLEIGIGTGPCYAATLTIVIRSQLGEVLYAYVALFKRHVATHWQDSSLDKDAARFVNEHIANGMGSSKGLPPHLEPNDYHAEHGGEIKIPRLAYEALRRNPRPMFEHANHYEGWQYVVYDEAKGEAVIVVTGGA